ncbi:MAG: HAD-IA family hydrolase [bacterium]
MRAIVFDVDGVLINSKDESGKYLWDKNIEKDLGLTTTQTRQIYSGDWALVMKGLLDTRQYFKMMFTKLNIGLSIDDFIEYWIKHDSNTNTEILQTIKSIKNTKLYVGTNQDRFRTDFLQKKFKPYFDGFFPSYQIGAIKPEPEFFRYVESTLNIQSKDIAFIDDLKSNIEAATKLGWTCHHYQNIEDFKIFMKDIGE